METIRAVAAFSYIAPGNLTTFKEIASKMLSVMKKQESILRYDFAKWICIFELQLER
jgi:hypothetical protein